MCQIVGHYIHGNTLTIPYTFYLHFDQIMGVRCGCLVTWCCCHLTTEPGSKTAAHPWLYTCIYTCTVYPKKYAHVFVVLCFVVVMQSFIMNSHEVFIHIHQGCFACTGAIARLPQCQWSKPDGYGKISQYITTTKHSKAKTVCIFLGTYCTIHVYIHVYIYTCTYTCIYMYICMYIYMYIHVYSCTYVCNTLHNVLEIYKHKEQKCTAKSTVSENVKLSMSAGNVSC